VPGKIIVNVLAVRDPYVQDPGRSRTVTVEKEPMPVAGQGRNVFDAWCIDDGAEV
jgi:hypothetical protein